MRFFDKYVGLLSKEGKTAQLDLQAKRKPLPNQWYVDVPARINTVSNTVKRLLSLAGITDDDFKNHSLRSSSLTSMYVHKFAVV